MNYRLKDKELQKRLDELTGGLFSIELANAITFSDEKFITLECLRISKSSVEKVVEYNPHAWNDFPDVKPPENVWMRVEFDNRINGNIERHVARYVEEDGEYYWLEPDGRDICNVDRFRPWED